MKRLIIKGNAIFDSISPEPFKGAVAVEGNRIKEVIKGEVYNAKFENAETIEANDRLVMAGFHDSHTHLLMAGMFQRYVALFDCRSEEETARKVREAADADPNKVGWVYGFGWYHVFWEKKDLPTKKTLDKYFPDRPVLLLNAEAHGVWVNSKALEIADITRNTPDPFGGKIVKGEDGEPTGFLYENASGLATRFAYDFDEKTEYELIDLFLKKAAAYGITSVGDVMPYFHGNMGTPATYHKLDIDGKLTTRIHAAPDLLGDLDEVISWRNEYNSAKYQVNQLKSFLDGVSTTHTALMLEPYTDDPSTKGTPLFDLEAIKKAVPKAHELGFSVRLHTCGDASLRFGLDCFDEAIRLHGKNNCRHTLEHCEIVADKDIPRFGELGVIPSVQPEHLAITEKLSDNPYFVSLGEERANRTWPFRRLYESAGILAFGSDCPVVDNNPFLEIYRAITRKHNDGMPEGGWTPSEKLTLAEALRFYTYGSAYIMGREDELGSLTSGKFADIVILDRNLFTVSEKEIFDGKVDITIMDGKVIYRRES
jgi:predicted amidohydrolase YtcJ